MTDPVFAAAPAHAGLLAEIHAHAFPPAETWSADAFAIQLAQPGTFGLIDPRGGFVLARVAADEAEILTLAVLPERRRLGIARSLLLAAAGATWARGGAALFLEVSEANCAARALYAAGGFTIAGRRRRYYGDGSDALLLRLNLDRDAAAAG